MSKPTKLLLALKNAAKHLEITTNQRSSDNQITDSGLTNQPKSKLNRLTGRTYSSTTKRPSLHQK